MTCEFCNAFSCAILIGPCLLIGTREFQAKQKIWNENFTSGQSGPRKVHIKIHKNRHAAFAFLKLLGR